MTASVDLLVIGEDEAALCAAAAAARAGTSTALLRGKRKSKTKSASYCAIPNFVWRRLDLQDYCVSLEPVGALVTLFPGGDHVTTRAGVSETKSALAAADNPDHQLWGDFVADIRRLGDDVQLVKPHGGERKEKIDLPALFGDMRALSALGQLTGSCAAMLDDYFNDEELKAHVAAHALAPSGLGGGEAGGAAALTQLFDENAWRVRPAAESAALRQALEGVCADSGVSMHEGVAVEFASDNAKRLNVTFGDGTQIKTRHVIFTSPETAAINGYHDPLSPLSRRGRVSARMRVKLKKPIAPPAGEENAFYLIVDDANDLQRASDAVSDGRLPDRPPVAFEIAGNGDLIVSTAYCPKAFRDEEGLREWTGQDRQAVMKRMLERLESRISGLAGNIRNSEVEIIGAEAPPVPSRLEHDESIFILPNRHNAVAEAVKLVDKVLGRE